MTDILMYIVWLVSPGVFYLSGAKSKIFTQILKHVKVCAVHEAGNMICAGRTEETLTAHTGMVIKSVDASYKIKHQC